MNAVQGDAARLPAARARLLGVLGEISGAIEAQALVRCPYRDRRDRCTHGGPCRNRVRPARGAARCTGGPLDPRPAGPAC